MTSRSWEKWAQRYPVQGHRVIAPSWPGLDCEVEEIRRDPEAHVIIGHSFGGAIDSAPVKGVLPLPFSTLKSAWPVLGNTANKNKAIALTPSQFHYGFTKTLSEEESAAVYERCEVPGSARVPFQGPSPTSIPAPPRKSTSATGDERRCCSPLAMPTTPTWRGTY
ncbi:alpha/beta hydrolase [Streptomyces sp. NBC_01136]|uniref:hypothetical protein n=1 Tax=unclassified Streptomyces TaxID=2593676 RepID=UPI0032526385|nr:alpha/beta hydrolase [Streptomyces sp. NBC_01136]